MARKRLPVRLGADEITQACDRTRAQGSYCHVFGTLFCSCIIPGPGGAVLVSAEVLMANQRGDANRRTPMGLQTETVRPTGPGPDALARRIPRTSAPYLAVVGDSKTLACWRSRAANGFRRTIGIMTASGEGEMRATGRARQLSGG